MKVLLTEDLDLQEQHLQTILLKEINDGLISHISTPGVKEMKTHYDRIQIFEKRLWDGILQYLQLYSWHWNFFYKLNDYRKSWVWKLALLGCLCRSRVLYFRILKTLGF